MTVPIGAAGVSERSDTSLIAIAWAVTLLISRLPEIILRDILRIDVPWMPWAVVLLTAALWLLSRVVPRMRSLDRYLLVMTVLAVLFALIPLVLTSDSWRAIVPEDGQPMLILLAERMLLALLALLVVGIVLAMRTTRTEAYLVVGDLNGPTTSRRKDGSFWRWMTFGPIAFVGLLLLTAWLTAPLLPDQIDLAAALPFIGIGAVAAALNAFWEEVAYRAAPLSQLQRAIAPSMGVVILAVWFGLGHYYGGIPNGPLGAVAAGAVALLFGRAMIETRGLGWPLALHFAGDLVIYTFLAIASVAEA